MTELLCPICGSVIRLGQVARHALEVEKLRDERDEWEEQLALRTKERDAWETAANASEEKLEWETNQRQYWKQRATEAEAALTKIAGCSDEEIALGFASWVARDALKRLDIGAFDAQVEALIDKADEKIREFVEKDMGS